MFQLLSALFQCHYCFAGWRSSGSDSSASSPSLKSFHGNPANGRTESQRCACQVSQPRKVKACFNYSAGYLTFIFILPCPPRVCVWVCACMRVSSHQKNKAGLIIRPLEWMVGTVRGSLCSKLCCLRQRVWAALHRLPAMSLAHETTQRSFWNMLAGG